MSVFLHYLGVSFWFKTQQKNLDIQSSHYFLLDRLSGKGSISVRPGRLCGCRILKARGIWVTFSTGDGSFTWGLELSGCSGGTTGSLAGWSTAGSSGGRDASGWVVSGASVGILTGITSLLDIAGVFVVSVIVCGGSVEI